MGIDMISYLKDHDPEEYHVIIVGRAGDHPGTNIYLVGPGPKRLAISTGAENYRREKRLAPNIQLVTHCVYSGSHEGGGKFIEALTKALDKEESNGN
jgi:hypothetical protein